MSLSSASFKTHTSPNNKSSAASSVSIEAWLNQTPSRPPAGLPITGKRKRALSSPSPPHTPFGIHRFAEVPGGHPATMSELREDDPYTPQSSSVSNAAGNGQPLSTSKSKSTQSNEFKVLKDPSSVGRRLESHGLHQCDTTAMSRYPKFEKDVRQILNGARSSLLNPDSANRFQRNHEYYARANEDTFLQNILPSIIKTKRTVESRVRARAAESPEEATLGKSDSSTTTRFLTKEALDTQTPIEGISEKEKEYSDQYFQDDGLVVKINGEFRKTFLPNRFGDEGMDIELTKAMAKVDGMTNPRPDYTYGLRIDKHPIPSDVLVSPQIDFLLEVVPIMHHPFFMIEGKGDRGSMAEADNQACRGGATLVNAARILLERIGEPDVSGADDRTFVFSATLCPGLMEIWVHWAEVSRQDQTEQKQIGRGVTFHMNRLASKALNDDGSAGILRKMLHNILDWGCINRDQKLSNMYDKIFAFERRQAEERRKARAKDVNLNSDSKKRKTGKE